MPYPRPGEPYIKKGLAGSVFKDGCLSGHPLPKPVGPANVIIREGERTPREKLALACNTCGTTENVRRQFLSDECDPCFATQVAARSSRIPARTAETLNDPILDGLRWLWRWLTRSDRVRRNYEAEIARLRARIDPYSPCHAEFKETGRLCRLRWEHDGPHEGYQYSGEKTPQWT